MESSSTTQTVLREQPTSKSLLHYSSQFWFVCLLLCQWVFVLYLTLGYGVSAAQNNLSNWNTFNNTAYVQNDFVGNLMYGLHVLLAIVMMLGGSLQLIPTVRNRFIAFHKIDGRIFVLLACLISIAGMYLILVRGTVGNAFLHSMTFFSGVVVLASSFMAIKAVRQRSIEKHQVWAMRLFVAANGVLFFRLFIFAWFLTFGTLGVDTKTFTGPTVYAISIASYLFPLLILELYQRAKRSSSSAIKRMTSALLIFIGFVFLIGLFGISAANWYPSLFG